MNNKKKVFLVGSSSSFSENELKKKQKKPKPKLMTESLEHLQNPSSSKEAEERSKKQTSSKKQPFAKISTRDSYYIVKDKMRYDWFFVYQLKGRTTRSSACTTRSTT